MNTLFNETETAIVKVNASDYGLDSTKAQEIESMFTPMLEKMKALEGEYNQILKLEISPETCAQAKELRLKYVKVRTATAEIHKNLKDFYLKGGRFVDGWKNAQLFASQQIEETLKKTETHYEILEAERKEKLKTERTALIQQYVQDVNTFMLAEMSEDAFQLLLAGSKHQYEMRIAAEKKAEEERIEQENKNKILRDRQVEIAPYLEFLPKDIDPKTAYCRESHDYKSILSKAIEAKKKHDKEIWELKILAEKNNKAREKAEAELKEQQEAIAEQKRKEEAEIKANEEAAKKIKAQEEELQRKKLLAPDKEKLNDLAKLIEEIQLPAVSSNEAGAVIRATKDMLGKVTNYIREKAKTL